jgi:glycosyltransferase involved in cell wall biosynthesis
MALASKQMAIDFIGSNDLDRPELHSTPQLRFMNLRGDQAYDAPLATKIRRVAVYYAKLLRYAWTSEPKVFHILWNNKFEAFDRTVLMLYYKACGRKLVLTAHNVNAATRDSKDSLVNRLTLRAQYRLADHIFVHTEKMKYQLVAQFGARPERVSVIPFGINNSVPKTSLTRREAKRRLGVDDDAARTILFFGRIGAYKGLHLLVEAFERLAEQDARYRLIIAGELALEQGEYFADIERRIRNRGLNERVIRHVRYIPDERTEDYFKAADVLVLPYTDIFQSGVLFLGYSFGLPVIATDVGSLRDDIIEGQTGFLTRPRDPEHLAETLANYFESDLYLNLDRRRESIREYATARHSWDVVGDMTVRVYGTLGASPWPLEDRAASPSGENSDRARATT